MSRPAWPPCAPSRWWSDGGRPTGHPGVRFAPMRRRARAQREFLRRIDPDRRDALRQSLEAGRFEPPTLTSFTMTGASSLYGESGTHYEQQRLEAVPGSTPAAPAVRGESFERLTRAMANTSSRRQALKVLGAAAAAAVGAAVLKPLGAATAVTCPDGRQVCGNACCPKKYTCSSQ